MQNQEHSEMEIAELKSAATTEDRLDERAAQEPSLDPEPMLVDKRFAARLTGISERSIDRLVSCGKFIRPTRIGGRVMFHRRRLEEWVEHGCPPVEKGRP
jgi:predicted DNA-binding transcriptional regulator AlpA